MRAAIRQFAPKASPPPYLLDARLMQAWAVALHEAGDTGR